MFRSHIYKWAGDIYQQSSGGPIGLRASGIVDKAAMEEWIRKFGAKVESLGIKVHLLRKYVDDVVVIAQNAKLGVRYANCQLVWSQESEDEDLERGRTRPEVTLDVLKLVADEITP